MDTKTYSPPREDSPFRTKTRHPKDRAVHLRPAHSKKKTALITIFCMMVVLTAGCFDGSSNQSQSEYDPTTEVAEPRAIKIDENDEEWLNITGPGGSWVVVVYKIPRTESRVNAYTVFERAPPSPGSSADAFLVTPSHANGEIITPGTDEFRPKPTVWHNADGWISTSSSMGLQENQVDYLIAAAASSTDWELGVKIVSREDREISYPHIKILDGPQAFFWFDGGLDRLEPEYSIEAEIPEPGWTHIQFVTPSPHNPAANAGPSSPYQAFDIQFSNGDEVTGESFRIPSWGGRHEYVGAFNNNAGLTTADYTRVSQHVEDTLSIVHLPGDFEALEEYLETPLYCGDLCSWPFTDNQTQDIGIDEPQNPNSG